MRGHGLQTSARRARLDGRWPTLHVRGAFTGSSLPQDLAIETESGDSVIASADGVHGRRVADPRAKWRFVVGPWTSPDWPSSEKPSVDVGTGIFSTGTSLNSGAA